MDVEWMRHHGRIGKRPDFLVVELCRDVDRVKIIGHAVDLEWAIDQGSWPKSCGIRSQVQEAVGIHADGRVAGVRVTAHRETPGLGDYIDPARGPWIRQFDGRSLADPLPDGWRVKKDGGRFDYLAGATITPRAVVKAVRRSLEYFAAHRDELLAPTKQEAGP